MNPLSVKKNEDEDEIPTWTLGLNDNLIDSSGKDLPDIIRVDKNNYIRVGDKKEGYATYKCHKGKEYIECSVNDIALVLNTKTGVITKVGNKKKHSTPCINNKKIGEKAESIIKTTTSYKSNLEYSNPLRQILNEFPIRTIITRYDFQNLPSYEVADRIYEIFKKQSTYAYIARQDFEAIINDLKDVSFNNAWFILTSSDELFSESLTGALIGKIFSPGKHEILNPIQSANGITKITLNDKETQKKIRETIKIFEANKKESDIFKSSNEGVFHIETKSYYIYIKHLAALGKGTYWGSSLLDRVYQMGKSINAPIFLEAVNTSVGLYKKEGFVEMEAGDPIKSIIYYESLITHMIKYFNK